MDNDIIEIEKAIKFIFDKTECTDTDVELANYYIGKWKKLTNWKEDTTQALKFTV